MTIASGLRAPPRHVPAIGELPACIPGMARAAIAAASRCTFAFSKPDFAGQMQITARSGNRSFSFAIVGNDDERYQSYLVFVEYLRLFVADKQPPRMNRAQ